MKSFTIQGIAVAAIIATVLILGQGCAALKGNTSSGSLSAAVAAIAPQYAAQAAQLETILGKSKAKTESATQAFPPAGYSFLEVYRYKGTVVDAADLSRDLIYTKTETGSAVFDPVATASNVPAANVDADEQTAQEIADWLDSLLKEKK